MITTNDPSLHRLALLPEKVQPGRRLGRHVHFDERSRAHRVNLSATPAGYVTKIWARKSAAFNQGTIGSCTGNGAVGVIATAPFALPGKKYNETLAKAVYSKATSLDAINGSWKPDDTGSTVLAAMKALQALGLITEYKWCFGIDDVLKTLSHVGPVEVGVNWYAGFDNPSATGLVKVAGQVRGGHAFELHGIDVEKKLVWATNSWGKGWGVQGRFCFSFDNLARLLTEDGEASTVTI